MRRPGIQAANQKPKPKFAFTKATPSENPASGTGNVVDKSSAGAANQPAKMTLADWAAGDGDDYYYAPDREPRPRGGRRKKKKTKGEEPIAQDWDDLYDPTRPNNYEEYMHSEERIREIREWKERLYAHRSSKKNGEDDLTSDSEEDRPRKALNGRFSYMQEDIQALNICLAQFAPPPSYNFAPPAAAESKSRTETAPVDIDMDETPDEIYARRVNLSQTQQNPPPPPPPQDLIPPPPPTAIPAGTISRAPVRYSFPAASPDIPATEAELEKALEEDEAMIDVEPTANEPAPRSSRPGQKGFAERLMSKYGWTKGSGLGASGTGITSALKVKVDKKMAAGHGKIIGGKRKVGEEEGKFGAMSEVVILRGMVDGLDLRTELGPDGNLMQEIGEECGDKVRIWDPNPPSGHLLT